MLDSVVYIRRAGAVKHPESCACDKCDFRGTSYRSEIVPVSSCKDQPCVGVEYGASEGSSILNARIKARDLGYEVVNYSPESHVVTRPIVLTLDQIFHLGRSGIEAFMCDAPFSNAIAMTDFNIRPTNVDSSGKLEIYVSAKIDWANFDAKTWNVVK